MEEACMSNQDSTSEIGTPARTPDSTEARLREYVSDALKHCSRRITREQVAQELTTITGHKITKRMLDDWATPSKKGLRVPAFLVKPLCEITGHNDLAMAVVPYRVAFLVAMGQWVFESRRTLERIHQDLLKLTHEEKKERRQRSKR